MYAAVEVDDQRRVTVAILNSGSIIIVAGLRGYPCSGRRPASDPVSGRACSGRRPASSRSSPTSHPAASPDALSLRARLRPRSTSPSDAQQEPLLGKPAPAAAAPRHGRRSFRQRLALAASTALAAASLVLFPLAVLRLSPRHGGADASWRAVQCAFLAPQLLAHVAAAGTVATVKAAAAAAARSHLAHLRLFWLATGVLGELFSGSVAAPYASHLAVRGRVEEEELRPRPLAPGPVRWPSRRWDSQPGKLPQSSLPDARTIELISAGQMEAVVVLACIWRRGP